MDPKKMEDDHFTKQNLKFWPVAICYIMKDKDTKLDSVPAPG